MWFFQVMHSSTITPRVLVDETRLMLSDPIDRIGLVLIWDCLVLGYFPLFLDIFLV
jgi:hypothetical protein